MTKGKYERKKQHAQQKAEQSAKGGVIAEDKKSAEDQAEPAATTTKKPVGKHGPSRWLRFATYVGSTLFTNQCIAAFTLVLAVCACYQFIIMGRQLDTMRKDQRPWVKLSNARINEPAAALEPFSGGVEAINFGRTPARRVRIQIVIDKVKNGESPTFHPQDRFKEIDGGTLFPNEPQKNPVNLAGASLATPNLYSLSQMELEEFRAGKIYLVMYARVMYSDFFNTDHWTHFCIWQSSSSIPAGTTATAMNCANYNDVDSN